MPAKYQYPMDCREGGCKKIVPIQWKKNHPELYDNDEYLTHGGKGLCTLHYQRSYYPGRSRNAVITKLVIADIKKTPSKSSIRRFVHAGNDGWKDRGLCVGEDPRLWDSIDNTEARKICRRCPVRGECLAAAIENNEYGVWADTTWDQRQGIKRAMRAEKLLIRSELA